jgi:hypothetical protein
MEVTAVVTTIVPDAMVLEPEMGLFIYCAEKRKENCASAMNAFVVRGE